MTAITCVPVFESRAGDAIEDLALQAADGYDVLTEARRYVSPGRTDEELALALTDIAVAVRMRDGLATGWVTWQEAWPELTCADRQETALQRAAAEADEFVASLRYGHVRGN